MPKRSGWGLKSVLHFFQYSAGASISDCPRGSHQIKAWEWGLTTKNGAVDSAENRRWPQVKLLEEQYLENTSNIQRHVFKTWTNQLALVFTILLQHVPTSLKKELHHSMRYNMKYFNNSYFLLYLQHLTDTIIHSNLHLISIFIQQKKWGLRA